MAAASARLWRCAWLSAGGQTPRPQATLPSSVSAPITRQPSFFLPPTTPTATPHSLPSRPFSVAAADGQHQGLPSVKGADRRPEAGLQLPELHPSPSVASAPCSGRSGSAVARGLTGTTFDIVETGLPNTMQLTCQHWWSLHVGSFSGDQQDPNAACDSLQFVAA